MPTITKRPDDPWPNAARGLEIQLLPGVHRPVEFSGEPDMTIQGCEGAIIEGSLNPGGEPECSIRINDGADRFSILGPLEVRGSDGRGVRITMSDEITLSDLYIHHCAIEGIITGGCDHATYTNITIEDSEGYAPGYPPDKAHGLYISGNADGSTVTGLTVRRVTGSGLQCNGAGMDAVITNLQASELVFEHCGSGGTPPISLMAVRDSTIEKFCEDWTAGDRWAVLFADGHGSNYSCRNVTFRDYTVPRGTECAEEEGSGGNHFAPGDGWSPDAPTPPEPEPEPPPAYDPQHDLAELKTTLQTALAIQARLEAGLLAPGARAG